MGQLADRQAAERAELSRKLEAIKRGADDDFEREKRRYNCNRQANRRLKMRLEKYGEDSVKLSKGLSNA